MSEFRKLTPRDLALGIGRKATKEELQELLNRPDDGTRYTAEEVKAYIKEELAKRRLERASKPHMYY